MDDDILQVVSSLVGLRCSQAGNPIGSLLTLDFGEMSLPKDPLPKEVPIGWRVLTVYSPWRVQDEREVLFDWTIDGGAKGILRSLVKELEGATVLAAATSPPAWDLVVRFSNGASLQVFGDDGNGRTQAWFIIGTDGTDVSARPRARPTV